MSDPSMSCLRFNDFRSKGLYLGPKVGNLGSEVWVKIWGSLYMFRIQYFRVRISGLVVRV